MKSIRFLSVLFVISFCMVASVAVRAQNETVTNQEVISLTKAGLSKSIIINKIRTSKSNFNLSTDALIELKKAGVDDDVVAAMLQAKSGTSATSGGGAVMATGGGNPNDPMSPHDFGIYMYEEKNGEKVMTQLLPSVSAQNRTGGGFTQSVTPFGLGKVKTKANLPGTTAKLQIKEAQPVFYFYLDTKSGGMNTSSGIPSTPNEFTLIKFNIRSDNREVTIAKSNAYGAKGGLSDEYVVPFTAESVGSGIFKVTPSSSLKNGEYGFYLINSGGSNTSAAVGAKFFDFGVRLTP
ncbi:MAG: hypothetical protein ACR2HG_03355 [Pyrinomonadaceae bacterium]